jgi:hypothetical protein
MRAELHDGRVLEFPDGTDPAVIQATVKRLLSQKAQAPEMNLDPTEGMSFFEKAAAGLGKSVADTGLGVRQLMGNASQQEVAESAKRDAPLMKTGAGMGGNVFGQILQMAAPGAALGKVAAAAPYISSAAQAAGFAATQPVLEGDSRLQNAAVGGALGAAGQGVASLAGKGISALSSKVSPEVRALYDKAMQAGIPVNAAQLSDSRVMKTLQSTLERIPFTGAQGKREVQEQAYNRAVSRTFGEDAPKVTREVYAGAKARIGGVFERLTANNHLRVSDELLDRMGAVGSEAAKFGNDDSARAVANAIDELLGKADESGVIPGRAYQALDSKLGKLMKAGGEKSMYLGELRDAIRSAMDDSISAADKEAWKTARKQYKNLKTVRDLVAKEGADGNINPALLMGRVNSSQAGKEANAMGRGGEMADLARIGRQFVRDPIPDSGTASRMATMGLLGGGAGVRYDDRSGLSFDPLPALLMLGGAATAGRGASAAINSELAARYLMGGGLPGLMLSGVRGAAPAALPASGLLYLSQQ